MDSGTNGSRLSYVQIDGVTPEPFNADNGSVADQIWVHATGNSACLVYGTLLDSVCWTTSAGDDAINGGVSATFTPVLRNVTAESTGPGGIGIDYHASGGGNITISATNVIAHGGSTDLFVQATSPDNATINIDHSNFAAGSGSGTGAHLNSTAKQSAPPLFVNAAAGDFNEIPGSPTIDAGVTEPGQRRRSTSSAARASSTGARRTSGRREYDPLQRQ